nr:immunoglobulin light chain junction region [Macaca mulatta]MPN65370.1 immunoglobulin light chain junction region [Macaca mulatta]MPN65383.1 immunoglobulin light chain junction region [Macaca mulatta]MPN65939.1 immunoglobulin light chain junction region [Macaca mulatta]MPN66014.1 immunoglobulin light chain junction region [Macaca mulatta]
CAVGHTSGRLF